MHRLWLGAAFVVGCHGTEADRPRLAEAPGLVGPSPHAFGAAGLHAPDDPTVLGARLLPQTLAEARAWGADPGGGKRVIVAGLRVVSSELDGGLVGSSDRFPASPSSVVSLPARLGGGFLFAVSSHLWRSSTWLGEASPILVASKPLEQVVVGLDRVYVRFGTSLAALDPQTGAPLDLGPLPAAPHLGPFAALDAWRALAVADLGGVLMTVDAGSTWQRVPLPFDPQEVVVLGQTFAAMGPNSGAWWQVRPDGQSDPHAVATPVGPTSLSPPPATDSLGRIFGRHPLVAAVEDGWPLVDATAVIARNGALARIRLSDGVVVEVVFDAFPLPLARCHPLNLATAHNRGAFGFVCGEPEGETRVYAWDAVHSGLTELHRFDDPRQVLAFGNGAMAVRGPCRGGAAQRAGAEPAWCVMAPQREWSELRIRGDDTGRARPIVLSDGRLVVLRPPLAGDLSTATLTLVDGVDDGAESKATAQLGIRIPPVRAEVARALELGVWMDGFEERRPGVLGGWVDGAGAVVGIEIATNGEARIGEYIRDAGAPFVSGRWGFGWTASRRGFETIDGGMTWTKEISLPDSIADPQAARERVCGPIGCLVAGWVRVGWGARPAAPVAEPPPLQPWRPAYARALQLQCAPALPAGPLAPASPAGDAAPRVAPGYSVVTAEATNFGDPSRRGAAFARLYAWGPTTGDWSALGRWEVRWDWPWGSAIGSRAASGPAPWPTLDAALRSLGVPASWTLVNADDADHALLVARRPGASGVEVFVLEGGRPPLELLTADGSPFPDLEGAVRIAGHWYAASPQRGAERKATVVWILDGPVAHELVRLPRASPQARPPAVRLARRTDGRALGVAVDGQPDLHEPAAIWIVGVDLDTGASANPVSLPLLDRSDRPIGLCTGDDSGWELEMPYPGDVQVRVGDRWESSLRAALVRATLSPERACLGGVAGWVDRPAPSAADPLRRAVGSADYNPALRTIGASLYSARASGPERAGQQSAALARFPVRCWVGLL